MEIIGDRVTIQQDRLSKVEVSGALVYGAVVVDFDNSGVFLEIIGDPSIGTSWSLHFTPENNEEKISGKENEYSCRFAHGLNHLIDWYLSFDAEKYGFNRPDDIIGATNLVMNNFMINFLGNEIYSYDFYPDHEEDKSFVISINIPQLLSHTKILRRIENLSRRYEKQYIAA